jgi:hypothetical protein
MMTAEQNALTMTPERRRESFFKIVFPEDMTNISRRVAILPVKAVKLTPGKREKPSRIPVIAPMADPPEIPRMYGSARGEAKLEIRALREKGRLPPKRQEELSETGFPIQSYPAGT